MRKLTVHYCIYNTQGRESGSRGEPGVPRRGREPDEGEEETLGLSHVTRRHFPKLDIHFVLYCDPVSE